MENNYYTPEIEDIIEKEIEFLNKCLDILEKLEKGEFIYATPAILHT